MYVKEALLSSQIEGTQHPWGFEIQANLEPEGISMK